jgi:biotin transport system substrate-specific component
VRNRATVTHLAGALSAVRAHGVLLVVAPVIVFALLTALGAQIRVPLPFTPVPVTLQTFFVFLAGGLLGARRGVFSQILYLSLGAMGLPVFALGSAAILGPTGGYLVGFAVSVLLVGWLTAGSRGTSLAWTAGAMGLGLGAIYVLGTVQLMALAPIGFGRAVSMGVLPFLVGDMAKLALASGIVVAVRRRRAI